MERNKKEKKNPEGKVISFSDRIQIRATSKSKHLNEGQEYSVHPVLGEKLIKKGAAEKITLKKEKSK